MTEININKSCEVVLSFYGANFLNEKNNDWNKRYCVEGILKKPVNYKEGDVFQDSLWEIMNIFGDSINLGSETPFKNNVLFLDLE